MGYSYSKAPVESCWLDLGTDIPTPISIPSYLDDTSGVFLRVFQQETNKSRTTFPTNIMRSYIGHSYIISQVGFNLYKEAMPTAQCEIGNTKLLLGTLRTRQAYSCDLRHATNRVALATEDGIHYADAYDNFIPKEEYELFNRDSQLICDGIITNVSRTTLIGYSADCVLAKLEDPAMGAVGIFHAQWRNLIGKGENYSLCKPNIVEEMIYRMETEFGSKAKNIQAVLYPSISQQSFKVGPDVAQAFAKAGLRDCVYEDIELWEHYVDIQRAVVELLKNNGITQDNIDVLPYTTDDVYFYSKRLSRTATVKSDTQILSANKYNQRTGKPVEQKLGPTNPQNLLIVKKF